ncbi:MAG TPA: RNA polymerase sigma factor SigJ [Candidatus Limnocylindria bacterium]|nr:RNA polymerase sigma factor SigJ [Candidatus Limnocylindria bacterium]
MSDETLAEPFEEHRSRLRAVAYRMLGSAAEADDAVQDAWLRYRRADTDDVANLSGWLTTVVARICLNRLRARRIRPEDSLDAQLPEPIVSDPGGLDPEQEALLGDAVGMAMLIVLDQLTPAERVAFVLHDVFAVPFDEVAPIVDRTPAATRQLASRARRRVQGTTPRAEPDVARQRAVLDAFLAASRQGDFQALLAVLDPDVVVRADAGALAPNVDRVLRGREAVAKRAFTFRGLADGARPALVNGAAGLVVFRGRHPFAVMAFTVAGDRIVEIDILADPERLATVDVSAVSP